MHEGKILSVFVDESGRFQYPDKDSRFYIVGMVFHDQSMEISRAVEEFKRSLLSLGLDSEAFVFHAGPLIRREKMKSIRSRCIMIAVSRQSRIYFRSRSETLEKK